MSLTQCDKVLRHLEDFGTIDSLTAMSEYGIMRLASRISDLKAISSGVVTTSTPRSAAA